MPQFLSATTTSSSTATATANGGGGSSGGNGTSSTATLVEGLKKQTRSAYHSHTRSSHVDEYDEATSSDAEVHNHDYPDVDDDDDELGNGHKNGGFRLKLNRMETVSRTPKEHFSDQGPAPSVTNSAGNPIGTRDASLTVGPRGPVLLQDNALIDEIAHFTRERIPERVVHAKGAGAFGYFEVTHDISKYCVAGLFDSIGKRTPIAVRFSTVAGESGSADTVRDPRGFAIKFYTEEGNWDLAGNNTPIFFIRDPMLFPSFVHTQKRNPSTHLKDPDMFWDMMSLRPETTHQLLFHYSDRGIPDGYRFMNGYASHTYKMTNKDGQSVYVKFHHKSAQGIKNMDVHRAEDLVQTDPDYAIRDLYNAIERKEFPQYNMSIQVMTFEQAEKFKYNPFDLTKVWPQKEYPLIPVGKLVLDRNPKNYYAEVEQIGFSPSHLVPGIDASPDKMLQARLFAYADTHRHRLGANHLLIPVNCPYRSGYKNYQRDGPMMVTDNQAGAPNYFPNSFGGPQNLEHARKVAGTFKVSGDVNRYQDACDDEDYFGQPRDFWNKVLDEDHRQRLIQNLAAHLKTASPFLQERAVKNFAKVDASLGRQLTEILRIGTTSSL